VSKLIIGRTKQQSYWRICGMVKMDRSTWCSLLDSRQLRATADWSLQELSRHFSSPLEREWDRTALMRRWELVLLLFLYLCRIKRKNSS